MLFCSFFRFNMPLPVSLKQKEVFFSIMYQTTSGCDDISRALHGGRATVKPDTRGVQAGGEPAGTIQNAQIVVLARKRLAVLWCNCGQHWGNSLFHRLHPEARDSR